METWYQRPEDDFHAPASESMVYHFVVRPHEKGGFGIVAKTSVRLSAWRFSSANDCVQCIKRSLPNYRLNIEVYGADGQLFKTVVREP